jgi:hypothetical protein
MRITLFMHITLFCSVSVFSFRHLAIVLLRDSAFLPFSHEQIAFFTGAVSGRHFLFRPSSPGHFQKSGYSDFAVRHFLGYTDFRPCRPFLALVTRTTLAVSVFYSHPPVS